MGGKITDIVQQKRNKERVSIFLDGEYAFGLPAIEAANLRQGQELSDAEISRLQAIDEQQKALDAAVRYLARRARSTGEIRSYLAKKEYPNVVIDNVLHRLEDLGYIDDQAFAEMWVRDRERFRPRGPHALRVELRRKGVADSIIDEALADLDAQGLAEKAAEKKVASLRGTDKKTFKRRLRGYLSRRGFGYGTVNRIVNDYLTQLADPDNPETPYFQEDMNANEE